MKVPQLRKHATGQWFVHYGGRDHYLGHDKDSAEEQYLEHLGEWRQWRQEKIQRRSQARTSVRLTVADVAERFLVSRQQQIGVNGRYFYEKSLRHFLRLYGDQPADWLRPRHLEVLKSWMLSERKKPKTINHALNSIRSMIRWAGAIELIDSPPDFGVIPNVPLGPVSFRHATVSDIHAAVRRAPEYLRPWLATQYLTLTRPSEVIRLVNREGHWQEPGVFVLDRGKMDRMVSMQRRVIISDEALGWLEMAEVGRYRTLPGYSSAVGGYKHRGKWRNGPFEPGPKIIQKSAAQHLVMRGVPESDIELLLGHYKKRMDVTYYSRDWQRLRRVASLLGLGPAAVADADAPTPPVPAR